MTDASPGPGGAVSQMVALLTAVTASSHTLVVDTVAPWVRRIAAWHPALRGAGAGFASATADLDAAAATHGLTRIERASLVDAARLAPLSRDRSPWLSRSEFVARLRRVQADPGLRQQLASLDAEADELGPIG